MGAGVFDQQLADDAVQLFQALKLSTPEHYGDPITLLPYQRDWLTRLIATKDAETGLRLYTESLLTVPVQNGKTTAVSLLILYFLASPECQGYFILSGAPSHKQSRIIYENCEGMIRQNPTLQGIFEFNKRDSLIGNLRTGARYQAIANNPKGVPGFSADVVIVDEAAEFEGDDRLFDALRNRVRARKEGLVITTSTAGPVPNPEYWFHAKYKIAKQIRDGIIESPHFLPAIYEADEKADPFDEAVWYQANPSLAHGIAKIADVRKAAEEAKHSSRALSRFRRSTLNQWVIADEAWLSADLWNACADPSLSLEQFKGQTVYLGIDAASNNDLCALNVWIPQPNGEFVTFPILYIPRATAAIRGEKDSVPYVEWAKSGAMIATAGETTDWEAMRGTIKEISRHNPIRMIGIDRKFMAQMANELQSAGYTVFAVNQGFQMSPALVEIERLLTNKKLRHPNNPCLNWCFANCMAEQGHHGDIKLIKSKGPLKIDGIVAMGIAAAACYGDKDRKADSGKKASGKVHYVQWG